MHQIYNILCVTSILLVCTCLTCCSGESASEQDPGAPVNEILTEDIWFIYTSNEAGFSIDALFEPINISDDIEGQGGYKLGLNWPVANPHYDVYVIVNEIPVSTNLIDAQQRALTAAMTTTMNTAEAIPVEVVFETRDERLFAIAKSKIIKTGEKVFFAACTAYKAVYMLAITGIGSPEAEKEAERIFESFTLLKANPTGIVDAKEAENSIFFIGDNAPPEILEEIAWGLELSQDPNRGVDYSGPYNQPELTELQTQHLRKIASSLKEAWPIPWETWVFNIRVHLAEIDANILAWAKTAMAWKELGNASMTEGQKSDFLNAGFYAAKKFEISKLEHDARIGLSTQQTSAIQSYVQGLSTDDVENWLDVSMP